MPSIHLCLISQQVLANLIPAFSDEDIEGVIAFLGDNKEKEQKITLEELLATKNIKIINEFSAEDSFDYEKIAAVAETVKSFLIKNFPNHQWKINVTGGTKPMSFAVSSVFRGAKQAYLIYQDSQHQLIRSIDSKIPNQENKSVLNEESYLAAHNFCVQKDAAQDPDELEYMQNRKHILDNVYVRNLHQIWRLTSTLNIPASNVIDNKKQSPLKQEFPPQTKSKSNVKVDDPCTERLLRKLEREGLYSWDANKKTITFTNREAATFLAGGWLEEYAYWCAVEAGIEHIGLNVEGEWNISTKDSEKGSKNEFDLVLCHRNQLLVVECKSGALGNLEKGQDIVNKLDALSKRIGGLYGQSMLLMKENLQNEKHQKHLKEAIKTRLSDYKIQLVDGENLKFLTEKFKTWKTQCEQN